MDDPAAAQAAIRTPPPWRLGLIVPKRHARRAVTRVLIRRQARVLMAAASSRLPRGDWVVRLRLGFDVKQYPSAASDALRRAVRAELTELTAAALRRAASSP